MKHTLEKTALLETIEDLGSGKKTGGLHLTDATQEITIYVDRGAVIYITGTDKQTRLEYLLIRKKFISIERMKDLLSIAKKNKQPLLQVLVKKRLATLATAEKLMAFHARYSLLKALSWTEGTFEFKPSQTGDNPAAKIRYDCRQFVRDNTSAPEGSTAAENAVADESSQITGPSLKNAILQTMEDLPPNLRTVVKAKETLADKNADFEALNRILETDQSMVAKILKIANSSYYGMSGKISSLKHAISMLGINTLSQVITLAGIGDFLNRPLKGYNLSAKELRSHSLSVGFGSRNLAALVSPAAEEDAFIAGLLHDAGKIMLSPYVAENQLDLEADGSDSITDLEKRVLECDHSEVAGDVFLQWHFPDRVVDAIRFHHTPDQSGGMELAYILNAANRLAKVNQDEVPIYEIDSVLDEHVSDFLGLEQEDISDIFIEIKEFEKNID